MGHLAGLGWAKFNIGSAIGVSLVGNSLRKVSLLAILLPLISIGSTPVGHPYVDVGSETIVTHSESIAWLTPISVEPVKLDTLPIGAGSKIITAVRRGRGIGVGAIAIFNLNPIFRKKIVRKVVHLIKTPQPVKKPQPAINQSQWFSSKASQYGGNDGFYYGHLACGGVYYPNVIGVANKSIACGTRITFLYNGNVVTMRVIDRGPYCCGRDWDFTARAAHLLGFNGIGIVKWRFADK